MSEEDNKYPKKFLLTAISIALLLSAVTIFFLLRTREYKSDNLVIVPLKLGWIVEIRTGGGNVLLTAASSDYFILQERGSTVPTGTIVGAPSKRPVNYQDKNYYVAQQMIQDSDWVVELVEKDYMSAEAQIEPFDYDVHIDVRTYPSNSTFWLQVAEITSLFLFISIAVTAIVWICRK